MASLPIKSQTLGSESSPIPTFRPRLHSYINLLTPPLKYNLNWWILNPSNTTPSFDTPSSLVSHSSNSHLIGLPVSILVLFPAVPLQWSWSRNKIISLPCWNRPPLQTAEFWLQQTSTITFPITNAPHLLSSSPCGLMLCLPRTMMVPVFTPYSVLFYLPALLCFQIFPWLAVFCHSSIRSNSSSFLATHSSTVYTVPPLIQF